jgi:hypothetical protein
MAIANTGKARKNASLVARNATSRAEARTTLNALRGAEAPLFHGSARIGEFFRTL